MKRELPDSEQSRRRSRTILLAVLCTALIGAVGYNIWSARNDTVQPHTRSAADFIVTWRCLACGHEEQGCADTGSRTCPKCGKNEMYPCIRHACPRHGVFPVAFDYNENMEPIRLKVADGDWVPYTDADYNVNARCPRCGCFMMPAEAPRSAPRSAPVP